MKLYEYELCYWKNPRPEKDSLTPLLLTNVIIYMLLLTIINSNVIINNVNK